MAEDSLDARILEIGEDLRGRIDIIVDEELDRMRLEAPTFFTSDDPSFVLAYTSSCVAHFRVLVDRLVSGRDIPLALPPAAVEETKTVAQWGISLDALVQTYRTGHSVIWEHAMEVAERSIVDARVRSKVLMIVSRYLFAYTDRMVVLLAQVYEGERSALSHDRDRGRRQLVRDLLDGLPIDQSKLPYRVSGVHMAAILSGDRADRVLIKLAAQLGLTCLTVAGPSHSVWGWLGGPDLKDPKVQQAVVAAAAGPVICAFGDVAEGIQGFQISHREARQAFRIGRQLDSAMTRYADVALLSLTTMDESLARQFMTRELGFLADRGIRAEELRDTLRAYFASGHNASATAVRLSLNDRTVAYRLRSIEEKLGRPVASRRDELSVALRLYSLYGPQSG